MVEVLRLKVEPTADKDQLLIFIGGRLYSIEIVRREVLTRKKPEK